MRALVWIVAETWQATVTAAAAFLPGDADVTLLYVRAGDAESVARGARDGLLGWPRRAGDTLDAISEQSARDLLADAQAALGRQAMLEAHAGRIEHQVVAAAGRADLLVLARDEAHAHRGPRSLGPGRALRRRPRPVRRVPHLARRATPGWLAPASDHSGISTKKKEGVRTWTSRRSAS